MRVGVVHMDDFYRPLCEEDHKLALRNRYDFDCLEAFELDVLQTQIERARKGEVISYHVYDHAHHKPGEECTQGPFDVLIVEGLYLFACKQLLGLMDLRVFMDVDSDTSLIRRIRRDIVKRRRSVDGVLKQYERYVKPGYERLVSPSKQKAHIIIPRGAFNRPGVDSIVNYITSKVIKITGS